MSKASDTTGSDVQLLLPTWEVIAGPVVSVAPEVGLQSLAPTSGEALQTAVLTTTSGDAQLPLPAPEVNVGVEVSVASAIGLQCLAPTHARVLQTQAKERTETTGGLHLMPAHVQLFVAASSVSAALSDPESIVMPEVGILAPTSDAVSQNAVSQVYASETSTTMSTAPEVTVGAVVSVASQCYEIREKLGHGAGGSVHRATPRCATANKDGRLGKGGGPDSVALKLAEGKSQSRSFRPMDAQLAAMAVEAVAAAEMRRMAEDQINKWEGRIFIPVLHAVGKVAAIGDAEVHDMSAMVMEQAGGTLDKHSFAGDALVGMAWALASTLSALNKVGCIHGDLKPKNVLWKDAPSNSLHQHSCLHGWPLLTDFGASQHFQSFRLGVEMAPSKV
eukprot:6253153-Amphidinium_carterae.1